MYNVFLCIYYIEFGSGPANAAGALIKRPSNRLKGRCSSELADRIATDVFPDFHVDETIDPSGGLHPADSGSLQTDIL